MGKPRGKEGDPLMENQGATHSMRATDGEKKSVAPTIQAQFSPILAAIADTKIVLQQDIGEVSVGLELLRAEHRKLAERMMDVEKGVDDMHPTQ
ncbi:hypothetical protein NDU88_007762 [Pleurodeles waltl]|uniref:Uncharacterized protein n=1 Tax=Pleurodeles waltl TaxID=8319 RepID=A0AAV7NU86_PLEWA|nr:hypothetical protein NDU88_007762 [Pleurodeles waltl]